MCEWKGRFLHIQERETEVETLTATSSYRQLERNAHWLISHHQSKSTFDYLNIVWISWSSVWRKPLQLRCVAVTELCSFIEFHSYWFEFPHQTDMTCTCQTFAFDQIGKKEKYKCLHFLEDTILSLKSLRRNI